MAAFNIVRFRVKPGREAEFERTFRELERPMAGLRRFVLVKTGERSYCSIGEWDGFGHIELARPSMIDNLDRMRSLLEDLGGTLGVTDPVSGEAVVDVTSGR